MGILDAPVDLPSCSLYDPRVPRAHRLFQQEKGAAPKRAAPADASRLAVARVACHETADLVHQVAAAEHEGRLGAVENLLERLELLRTERNNELRGE